MLSDPSLATSFSGRSTELDVQNAELYECGLHAHCNTGLLSLYDTLFCALSTPSCPGC